MLNRLPKTIKKWIDKNQDKVNTYHLEEDGYSGNESRPYSIWCYLEYEWINPLTETSCIHAATVDDFMREASGVRMRFHDEIGI